MSKLPALVAIVNVTPDSFSDGGEAFASGAAVARVRQAFTEGATIVDIGGQSTRPGATLLSAEEEWARLADVLPEAIKLGGTISLDTFHPEVARKALALGVGWINDVQGFRNPAMITAVKDSACKLVVMHSVSIPADPKVVLAEDVDPVAEVQAFFRARCAELEAQGIARERIILDPGIGFGKTHAQSLALLLRVRELQAFGYPLLIGHSRKSFLSLFTDRPAAERDDLTLAFSAMLAASGVEYLRVHDAAQHRHLLGIMDAHMPHP